MIAFGPVPSRRLGFSLGINHIPPKHCTYACVYCQVGRTSSLMIEPRTFYPVDEIVQAVQQKVQDCAQTGQKIDYLTFVPDGEPTLDENLEAEIEALRPVGIPIAVISNASLVPLEGAGKALMLADWVSLKIDSVNQETWRRINRPHGHLRLADILEAIQAFAISFHGELVTETMLVKDLNDNPGELHAIAAFLGSFSPAAAYISSPIRPPAEPWVHVPPAEAFHLAYQVFSAHLSRVELLTEPEDIHFALTSGLQHELLSTTAVHPMRQDAVQELVRKSGSSWEQVEELIKTSDLLRLEYEGEIFYLRNLKQQQSSR